MHSGIPPGTAHSPVSAVGAMNGFRQSRPLMVIHGSVDRIVSASNGNAAVRVWAGAAGARAAKGRIVHRGKRSPATVTDFKLRSNTVATLVEVHKLGHAWSGGAASHAYTDAQRPDASRMMWAFAAKQFRVGGSGAPPQGPCRQNAVDFPHANRKRHSKVPQLTDSIGG